MPTTSARPTRTRTAPRIPIGLQVSARLLDGTDADWSDVRNMLAAADQHAHIILRDPLTRLDPEGAAPAVSDLAESFGAAATAKAITDIIPGHATTDAMALVTSATVPWMNAGLYLGLCLGWRLAGALGDRR